MIDFLLWYCRKY